MTNVLTNYLHSCQQVYGQRRMFLEELPPVVVLHLKLFDFSNGYAQKIKKNVALDTELEIPKGMLFVLFSSFSCF